LEVFRALKILYVVLLVMTPCSIVGGYWHFIGHILPSSSLLLWWVQSVITEEMITGNLLTGTFLLLQFSCSRSWVRNFLSSQPIAFPQLVATMILLAVVWSTDSCIPRNFLKFPRIGAVCTWWKCRNSQFAVVTSSTLRVHSINLLLPMISNLYDTLMTVLSGLGFCDVCVCITSTQKRNVMTVLCLTITLYSYIVPLWLILKYGIYFNGSKFGEMLMNVIIYTLWCSQFISKLTNLRCWIFKSSMSMCLVLSTWHILPVCTHMEDLDSFPINLDQSMKFYFLKCCLENSVCKGNAPNSLK
jgi:hypothetical protein